MKIKDVQANQGNIDLTVSVVSKEEPRTFEKFGKKGRVCSVKIKDESGELKLTLWNDDIDTVNVGDTLHLDKGWCSEFKGEKQLSTGKFGKIEIVKAGGKIAAAAAASKTAAQNTVFTNDSESLKRIGGDGDDDDGDGGEEETIDAEEFVE
ncbi:hypothetical protein J4444_04445 [Candidatus Woesearchaeota archaeon]|nr:hypothetical protein [Candidatus Woesearchaeota archaeon]